MTRIDRIEGRQLFGHDPASYDAARPGHPERVYSRAQLLDNVWGDHVFIEERTVDVHVLRLRKALAPAGAQQLVQTVRGLGYRLSSRVEA